MCTTKKCLMTLTKSDLILCGTMGTISKQIGDLIVDGQTVSGVSLAKLFNDYFVNITPTPHSDSALLFVHEINDSLFLKRTDETEIFNTFIGLRNSKTCDIDDLQIKPIKFVIDIISPCLAYVFNLSLTSGKFPENMKLAKISVIFKGGDKKHVE